MYILLDTLDNLHSIWVDDIDHMLGTGGMLGILPGAMVDSMVGALGYMSNLCYLLSVGNL